MDVQSLYVFTLLCIFVVKSKNSTNESLSTLRFVNVIFRHGDRTPVKIYPKNPITVNDWPQKSLGWLTSKGAQQTFELGEYIRNRYDGFLNKSYYHDELKIWSSDVFRTVMSAHSFLDGLYSSPTGQIIPVMTVGLKAEDDILYQDKHCPRKEQLRDETFELSDIAKETNKEYENMFRFLENETGRENLRFGKSIIYVVDCLICQEAHGFPLPDWYSGSMKEALLRLNDLFFEYYDKGDQLKRITGGPLLQRCTQTMISKQIPGIYKEKFHVYSAHDITISSLLTAMDIFDGKRPGPASVVLLELHEISPKNYSIQVLYKHNISSEAVPITSSIKGCSSDMCAFETFEKATKGGIPDDWEKECGLTKQSECSTQPSDGNKSSGVVITMWHIMTVVMFSVALM